MAWISGFADKAEQMLVKLDQNAADKLNKKNQPKTTKVKAIEDEPLTEVTTETSPIIQRARLTPTPPLRSPAKKATIPLVKSAPSIANGTTTNDEDKLIDFLNDSSKPVSEAKVEVEKEVSIKVEEAKAEGEKQLLKNEVRVLNNELSLLLHRTRAAEKESETLKNELQEKEKIELALQENANKMAQQIKQLCEELSSEKRKLEEQMTVIGDESGGVTSEEVSKLREEIEQLNQHQDTLVQRLDAKERECLRLESAGRQQAESLTQRLEETRAEMERLRARAQRTLGDREALINQLRQAGQSDATAVEDSLHAELDQLREERRLLSEEQQTCLRELETTRARLAELEGTVEGVTHSAANTQRELQDRLDAEASKRRLVEEDFRAQAQELRQSREEANAQRATLTARVRECEAELSEARSQLSAVRSPSPHSGPSGELEMRLSSLTRTLIHKQTALESATTERNQLRMQLEELEHKHREHLLLMHQARVISANDTDDAKAQVPSFMVESPFDTGVARRVKRAYSTLDAVSIRTGVFLRRYPLARIMVVLYVVLLHSLVLMVLYSRTPETNQK